MKTNARSNVMVHMQRRDFQCINKVKPGSTLFCDTGVLWVTQTGDHRDYILLPGDSMTVSNRGKVLVEAMRDTDFQVV
jgi:hypothetical protein